MSGVISLIIRVRALYEWRLIRAEISGARLAEAESHYFGCKMLRRRLRRGDMERVRDRDIISAALRLGELADGAVGRPSELHSELGYFARYLRRKSLGRLVARPSTWTTILPLGQT